MVILSDKHILKLLCLVANFLFIYLIMFLSEYITNYILVRISVLLLLYQGYNYGKFLLISSILLLPFKNRTL